jgi:hypothetical protein
MVHRGLARRLPMRALHRTLDALEFGPADR